MHMEESFIVDESESGERVDRVVAKRFGITRARVQKLIGLDLVLVDGGEVKANRKLRAGERVSLSLAEERDTGDLVAEPIPIDILYEDTQLVIVNKPAGLVVYPAAGHRSGTMMNALRNRCRSLASVGAPLRPGVVHRLDKDTSGVMVVAKTDLAYYHLQDQFRRRSIGRRYLALIYGLMKGESGVIEAAIGRHEKHRKKMSTRVKRGKDAVTLWKTLEVYREASLIEARLQTGRTHQIRVHLASVGHPVLGDGVYGRKTRLGPIRISRQMLHAEMLSIVHPETGEEISCSAPIPEDMALLMDQLRRS